MSPDLATLERLLWRSVRHDPPPPEVDAVFASTGGWSAQERIALYRRGYWYRQVNALFDGFPVLAREMGDERFTKTVCRYLTAHPSTEPVLERLGAYLPEFLRQEGAARELVDIAAIEWAQIEVLLAPDPEAILTPEDLDLAAFPSLRLAFTPAVAVCRARLAAFALVQRSSADHPPRSEDDARADVDVLVWRREHAVHQRIVPEDEAAAFARARAGSVLADVVTAFEGAPDPIRRAAQIILRWIGDRLVTGAFIQ